MKIYPSTHVVKTITDKHYDTDLNIPLAYVNIDYTKYDITTNIFGDFNKSFKRLLTPGERFNRADIKIFNEFKEPINSSDILSRVGNEYVYSPKSKIEFAPNTFYYQAIIKKNMTYRIANSYNIKVGCVDDADSLTLSKRLSQVFTNPAQRNLVPPNIAVNDNRMMAYDFTNMTMEETDFLFIETPDGLRYEDRDDSALIDYNSLTKYNVNTWLLVDDHHLYKYNNIGGNRTFTIQTPIVSNNVSIMSDVYFDLGFIPEMPGTIIHNPFNQDNPPLLILENIGKHFTVISHKKILDQLNTNTSLFYEILMYIYLRTYDSTPKIKEWICNKVPDYQIENGNLINKTSFISSFDMSTYFGLKGSEMSIVQVDITSDENSRLPEIDHDLYTDTNDIMYIGQSGTRLVFEKNVTASSLKTEPEKPIGWKAIYNGTNIMYVDKVYHLFEDALDGKIFTIEDNNDLRVKIMPFSSSKNGVHLTVPTDLRIPFVIAENEYIKKIREANYTVYMTDSQTIKFCFEEDYEAGDNLKLFDIIVSQTPDAVEVYDMRLLGGGLKEDELDNYNLMDIGNMQGRPYRRAGTVVFTMPTKYEAHREMILEAINKYIGAEEYAVLFFEDKEM